MKTTLGGQGQILTGVWQLSDQRGSLLLWILLPSQRIPTEPSYFARAHFDPVSDPLLIHSLPTGGLVWPSLCEATEDELTSEYVLCRTLFECGLFRTLFQDTGVLSPASVLSSNLKMWHLGTTCNPQEYNKTPLAITLSDIGHHPPQLFLISYFVFLVFRVKFPIEGRK